MGDNENHRVQPPTLAQEVNFSKFPEKQLRREERFQMTLEKDRKHKPAGKSCLQNQTLLSPKGERRKHETPSRGKRWVSTTLPLPRLLPVQVRAGSQRRRQLLAEMDLRALLDSEIGVHSRTQRCPESKSLKKCSNGSGLPVKTFILRISPLHDFSTSEPPTF